MQPSMSAEGSRFEAVAQGISMPSSFKNWSWVKQWQWAVDLFHKEAQSIVLVRAGTPATLLPSQPRA